MCIVHEPVAARLALVAEIVPPRTLSARGRWHCSYIVLRHVVRLPGRRALCAIFNVVAIKQKREDVMPHVAVEHRHAAAAREQHLHALGLAHRARQHSSASRGSTARASRRQPSAGSTRTTRHASWVSSEIPPSWTLPRSDSTPPPHSQRAGRHIGRPRTARDCSAERAVPRRGAREAAWQCQPRAHACADPRPTPDVVAHPCHTRSHRRRASRPGTRRWGGSRYSRILRTGERFR